MGIASKAHEELIKVLHVVADQKPAKSSSCESSSSAQKPVVEVPDEAPAVPGAVGEVPGAVGEVPSTEERKPPGFYIENLLND